MPVYNAEEYISLAINSILNQTFKNFEFIIINDGSNDNTDSIIKKIQDSRIQYYHFTSNEGIINRLNWGIQKCNGTFIARMDADDYSLPHRLQTQIEYLIKNKNVDIVGSDMLLFTNNTQKTHRYYFSSKKNDVSIKLIFSTPIAHPTAMIKKSILEKKPYHPNYKYAEDYFLWQELFFSKRIKIHNIHKILLYYRIHNNNSTKTYQKKQALSIIKIHGIILEKIGIDIKNEDELYLHYFLSTGNNLFHQTIDNLFLWLKKLNETCFNLSLKEKKVLDNYSRILFLRALFNQKNISFSKKLYYTFYSIKINTEISLIKIFCFQIYYKKRYQKHLKKTLSKKY